MAQYNPFIEQYEVVETPLLRRSGGVPGWQRMAVILLFIALVVPLLLSLKPDLHAIDTVAIEDAAPVSEAPVQAPAEESDPAPLAASLDVNTGISSVFTPEVQYWAAHIVEWSAAHGLDPNMAATIMQVESCGDPAAISSAGAQGLFQVMPFHFAAGEDSLDPDTNARRGLNYFAERLVQTNGDIGRAFAGYNGGQRAAASSWDNWPHETQRYYVWTTGIYGDIQNGLEDSPTVQEWLQAGGASLCRQAAQRLGL